MVDGSQLMVEQAQGWLRIWVVVGQRLHVQRGKHKIFRKRMMNLPGCMNSGNWAKSKTERLF